MAGRSVKVRLEFPVMLYGDETAEEFKQDVINRNVSLDGLIRMDEAKVEVG